MNVSQQSAAEQNAAATASANAIGEGEGNGQAKVSDVQVNRRQFMTLMGASAALAGLTACRWPVEKIAPYTENDANQIPGVPKRFATMMDLGGVAGGLLVTSYDGRPTKIEGNPLHPVNAGSTTAVQQASILDMYDPDRSQRVLTAADGHAVGDSGKPTTWAEFEATIKPRLADIVTARGKGFAVLADASSSPTRAMLQARLAGTLGQDLLWAEWESASRDNEREGAKLAFGQYVRPQYHLGNATVIVALDADIFDSHPAAAKHARDYAASRRVLVSEDGKSVAFHDPAGKPVAGDMTMSRMYAIESNWTLAGAMADHRIPVRSSQIGLVTHALAHALKVPDVAAPDGTDKLAATVHLAEIVKDLTAAGARPLVVAGARHSAAVHALVHRINQHLKASQGDRPTVTFAKDPGGDRDSHLAAITKLTAAINAGEVSTLLILGGNPVYDAPAELDFAGCLARVRDAKGLVIHHGETVNETARAANWHLPQSHYLECWGDGRAWDGTLCTQQPLIRPLYESRSQIELLAMLGGQPGTGYDLVRATVKKAVGNLDNWRRLIQAGVVPNTAEAATGNMTGTATTEIVKALPVDAATELVFAVDTRMYDGRFQNNGWLRELPDFITKVTWDNVLIVSPEDALGGVLGFKLSTGWIGKRSVDLVNVSVGDRTLENVPIWIQPGQARGSFTLWLGHGRGEVAGRVAKQFLEPHRPNVEAGRLVNAGTLRTSESMWVAPNVTITKVGKMYPLAATQDHFPLDSLGEKGQYSRIESLVRTTDVKTYQGDTRWVDHTRHVPDMAPLTTQHDYMTWLRPGEKVKGDGSQATLWSEYNHGHQWGLTIDLSTCIGCNACVAACNAENNIPIVGKDEIRRGREMHWLRIDRYFLADATSDKAAVNNPPERHMPVLCLQCENAPCEQVCPVIATSHSDEGTNDMVYNRCIGTRYCMNNCPVKVRKFNFFYNHGNLTEVQKMRYNPDVTVRSRGVMEKCSYCMQRITQAKIEARTSNQMETYPDAAGDKANKPWRPHVVDGAIQSACQQACPTHSIIFGDLNQYDRAHPGKQSEWSAVRRLQSETIHANQEGEGAGTVYRNRAYSILEQLDLRTRTRYLGRVTNPNPAIPTTTSQEGHDHADESASDAH